MPPPSEAVILELASVSKRFGGVQALDDINLSIPARRIFGIIGPNGAGKTTIFNCISGFLRQDQGRIRFLQQDLFGRSVHAIARLGIARTFQNISLIGNQTTRENLRTGLHVALPYSPLAAFLPLSRVRRCEAAAEATIREIADLLRLSDKTLDTRVDALSLGQQKTVEIARAIARKPSLLLLDEPAGGLNDRETAALAACLVDLNANFEQSIVLIDHDMNLVMDVCDDLAVLDFGRLIATGTPAEVQRNFAVRDVYLGTADVA